MIRLTSEDDLEALIALCEAFHEFHARGMADRLRIPEEYDNPQLQESLKRIIADDASAIFAVEVDVRDRKV